MTLDLAELRKLAAKLNQELSESQQTWSASGHFVDTDEREAGELLEVLEPQVYRRMLASYFALLTPSTMLALFARLERADQKLSAIRAHVVDAPHYVSADQLRQHLLEMLDADATVYPTLMTQVGKEKP